MDSFRKLPKMKTDIACYKEGGYVSRKSKKEEDHEDVEMDKAVIKKAVGQHESAKHKGEDKTELKLKKGGRAKKDAGSVRKYKTGGLSNPMKKGGSCHKEGGAISMKMDAEDKKKIAQVKKTKAGKADAPSAGAKKAPGKGVTNMADGGATPEDIIKGQGGVSEAERRALMQAMGSGAGMPRRRRPMQTLNMGVLGAGMGQGASQGVGQAAQAAQAGGAQALGAAQASQPMGAAANPGPMGGATPMGPEQDILRGLQAVGKYMDGGSVY